MDAARPHTTTHSRSHRRFGLASLLAALLGGTTAVLLLSSCTATLPKGDGARFGPFFTPTVFQAADQLPTELRRVLVLPIADLGTNTEETLAVIDQSAVKALNLVARFECVHVSRDALARSFHARSFRSTDALPHDFFQRLAQEYGADAVLFMDLVHYAPYPPVAVGLRAKLYRVNDNALLWAIDQTFDSANPSVANSARRHWRNSEPAGTPADMSSTALSTPSRFLAYVMSASFGTLPRR